MELHELGSCGRSALLDSNAQNEYRGHPTNVPDIVVERPTKREAVLTTLMAVGTFVLSAALVYLFVDIWQQETSYRAWLILAFVAPISVGFQKVWKHSVDFYERNRWIRVEVDSMRCASLFNAVADCIEKAAEAGSDTCSADVEGFTEYDKPTGRTQVRMRFWGSRSRTVRVRLPDDCDDRPDGKGRDLLVSYERGADVVCGRDQALQNRERMVLRMSSTSDRRADKELLKKWLLACVERYREPPPNVVEVMALDQTSTDWIPEWKMRCVRPMRRSEGTGHGFFLQRQNMTPILADACTWSGKELRIYLIVGPPGTGKTELTIWLAGYLRVPLYRLSLNDPRLSDQIFAQLVSPTSLRHDNAVIQIDEFQETLHRWKGDGYDSKGVSVGGFCEVLQGSNSLARGFIVLSGTQELEAMMRDPAYAAVFRRIAITTTLDWLSPEDLQVFFARFLLEFVPGCPAHELEARAKQFVQPDSPWSGERGHRISIDMAKQFLMLQISSFRASEMSDRLTGPNEPFYVPIELRGRFFDHLCDSSGGRRYLSAYPPVSAKIDRSTDAGGQ